MAVKCRLSVLATMVMASGLLSFVQQAQHRVAVVAEGSQFPACSDEDSLVPPDGLPRTGCTLHQQGEMGPAWLSLPRREEHREADRCRENALQGNVHANDVKKTIGVATLLKELGYVKIPFDRLRAGYLAVDVHINEKKLHLVIDTGAPHTCLDRNQTKQLKLKWEDSRNQTSALAQRMGGMFCLIEEMRIGPIKVEPLVIGRYDLSAVNDALKFNFDPPVDGLLGGDVFDRHAAVIDYPSRTLFLRPAKPKQ